MERRNFLFVSSGAAAGSVTVAGLSLDAPEVYTATRFSLSVPPSVSTS